MNRQKHAHHDSVDDEIDLIDVWLNVRRHKVAFLLTVVLFVLLGVALALFLPEKYEHKLVLEIGGAQTGGDTLESLTNARFQPVEAYGSVQAKIEESYAPEAARQIASGSVIDADSLVIETPAGTSIVYLSLPVPADETPSALEFLDRIADRVLADHNELLSRRIALIREVATERREELEVQLGYLKSSRQQVAAEGGIADKGITLLMIDSQIQALSADRNKVERQLRVDLEVNVRPTRVVIGPLRQVKPEPPGPILIIALSLLIGIIIGLFVVMIVVLKRKVDERSE